MRVLSTSTFANTIGTGLWAAGGALFLTRGAGLPTATVGVGLTAAGLVALSASVWFGNLADRRDPGRTRAAVQLLQAGVAACYLLVDGLALFVLVAVLDAVLGAGALSLRGALIAAVASPGRRVHTFAVLRTAASTGISVGVALAALALSADTRPAYAGLAIGRALAYLVSAGLHLRLPRLPTPAAGCQGWPVRDRARGGLRDRPYLAVMTATAVLQLNNTVLFFALPLWIVQQTEAPHTLISALLLLRTLMSVLLTVPVSRHLGTTAAASRALRFAGLLLAAGMLLYAGTASTSATATLLLLALATVSSATGELLYTSASSGLSYALADQQRIGNYQGVSNLLQGLVLALGPAVLTLVLLNGSAYGWVILAAVFAAAALATPHLIVQARRGRPA